MCGRFQRRLDKKQIAEAFGLSPLEDLDVSLEVGLAPNYNAAPGAMHPVVVWDDNFGMRSLRMMYWRFLPPFCSDPKKLKLDTIHASAEKLLSSNVWKKAFQYRRCLIPADSFVEWKKVDKLRLPFLFAMKSGDPFGIAGIWQHWRSPDAKTEMDTFAVVTVEPNEIVHDMTGHDRMPLLIQRKDYERWLLGGDVEQPPVDLLRPFDSDKMKAWRVGTAINSVRNNDPGLLEPDIGPEPGTGNDSGKNGVSSDGSGQMALFG